MSIVTAKRNLKASNGKVSRRKVRTEDSLKLKARPSEVRTIEALAARKGNKDKARIIVLAQRADRAWAERMIANLEARA